MPESSGPQAVLDAAKRAAATSDWVTAEKCLRLALRMQEVAVGPAHPELANTLNNLAVVCEVSGQLAEAEVCYRKAFSIASAAFAADHPFVATSRENLRQFCEAHDLPFDRPPDPPPAALAGGMTAAPAVTSPPPAPAGPAAPEAAASPGEAPIRLKPPERPVLQPPRGRPAGAAAPVGARASSRRRLALGAAIVGGLALTAIAALRPWGGADEVAEPPSAPAVERGSKKSAPPARTERAAPVRQPQEAPRASRLTVVDARLCARLSTAGAGEWTCTPPGDPVRAGQLTFYTRLTSPVDTEVEHRWYREDSLRQSGELSVRANSGAGYRTYSRHTITPDGAGTWRVELRAENGTVLHQERFVVR